MANFGRIDISTVGSSVSSCSMNFSPGILVSFLNKSSVNVPKMSLLTISNRLCGKFSKNSCKLFCIQRSYTDLLMNVNIFYRLSHDYAVLKARKLNTALVLTGLCHSVLSSSFRRFRCFRDKDFGTSTTNCTRKSPFLPEASVAPRPRNRNC